LQAGIESESICSYTTGMQFIPNHLMVLHFLKQKKAAKAAFMQFHFSQE
jgi:hypothetical protein